MSLFDYDIVNKVDKNHSWLNVKSKTLMSRDIPCKAGQYYTIAKKYNIDTMNHEYYIIIGDIKIPNANNKKMLDDFYGRAKIKLNDVWNELFGDITTDISVNVTKIEDDDNRYDIYQLSY